MNAVKHGLTAATVVLPGEDPAALEARVEAWKADLRPAGAVQDYLVERAAHTSWQLDRADRTIAARLADRMRHHAVEQRTKEADEVAELARQLFWDRDGPLALYPHQEIYRSPLRTSSPVSLDDPLHPARTVHRLEATATGCRWLRDRWLDLRTILERGLNWLPPDRLRCLRLMGSEPMDVLDDDRVMTVYLACGAMDPDGPPDFREQGAELCNAAFQELTRRIDARGAAARKPPTPEAGRAALLELIDRAVARLDGLLRGHEDRRDLDLAAVLDALAFDDTDDSERLRRYQLAHGRTLFRALNTFFKVRREMARDPGDPATAPGASGAIVAVGPIDDVLDETKPIPAGDPATTLVPEADEGAVDETKPILEGRPPAEESSGHRRHESSEGPTPERPPGDPSEPGGEAPDVSADREEAGRTGGDPRVRDDRPADRAASADRPAPVEDRGVRVGSDPDPSGLRMPSAHRSLPLPCRNDGDSLVRPRRI